MNKHTIPYPGNLNDRKSIIFLLVLIASISSYVFSDYISLNKLYLFKDIGSDSINVFLPLWIHVSDYLRADGIPMWSFHQGMGQNIFPFKLGNPFNLILYALGRDNLAYGIVYVEITKIILGGLIFYAYLRTISISYYAAIIGALSFSFSGFMILGGQWFVFSTEAVYLAFLLLSFEQYYTRNNWVLFPISVALIAAFLPFDLFLFALILFFYVAFRLINNSGFQPKRLLLQYSKLFTLSVIGLCLSSVFLVPNLIEMIDSPRVAGDSSYFSELFTAPLLGIEDKLHYVTAIMRLFSNDLMGTGNDFRGWYNYLEAPLFYCGLVNLVLAPQIFAFIDNRKRFLYGLLVTIILLAIIFPFFRYAFWAFTGDYYRLFSFVVSIAILLLSVNALDRISNTFRVNRALLILTGLFLITILSIPYFHDNNPVDIGLVKIVSIFIAVYTILIYFINNEKLKQLIHIALLLALCAEYGYFSSISVNNRPVIYGEEYTQKTGFNDYTVEAMQYLNSIDDSFYRIEKDYRSGPAILDSLNDALVQDYYGTTSYYSFNQSNYIKFLSELDIIDGGNEGSTRWAVGLGSRKTSMSIASVKYILKKKEIRKSGFDHLLEKIKTINDVTIYKYKYYLPLGFTYDSYILLDDFLKLTNKHKNIALLKALVVEGISDVINQSYTTYNQRLRFRPYTPEEYSADLYERKKDTLDISDHGQNYIKGTIDLDREKMLFLSIPYDPGWTAKVDGEEISIKRANIGFMGIMLNKGHHTVELSFMPVYLVPSMIVTTASLFIFVVFALFVRVRSSITDIRFIKFLTQSEYAR